MKPTVPPEPDRIYPCDDCGVMRTKAEGGTVFTVCDACWNKHHYGTAAVPSEPAPPTRPDDTCPNCGGPSVVHGPLRQCARDCDGQP